MSQISKPSKTLPFFYLRRNLVSPRRLEPTSRELSVNITDESRTIDLILIPIDKYENELNIYATIFLVRPAQTVPRLGSSQKLGFEPLLNMCSVPLPCYGAAGPKSYFIRTIYLTLAYFFQPNLRVGTTKSGNLRYVVTLLL